MGVRAQGITLGYLLTRELPWSVTKISIKEGSDHSSVHANDAASIADSVETPNASPTRLSTAQILAACWGKKLYDENLFTRGHGLQTPLPCNTLRSSIMACDLRPACCLGASAALTACPPPPAPQPSTAPSRRCLSWHKRSRSLRPSWTWGQLPPPPPPPSAMASRCV